VYMAEADGESSEWEDSSEEEPVKVVQKKKPASREKGVEPKMANEDADSMEDWEDSDDEPTPIEKKDPTKSKPPQQANEWDDDESEDEDVQERAQPKERSQNKNKMRRQRLRQKEMNSKRAKREEYSDDSSDDDAVNDSIKERNIHNQQGNTMLFGDAVQQQKKKKPKVKRKITLRDLYPINKDSRLIAKKDLNRFAEAISQYILDLSLGGEDQNKKAVKPVINPNMTKNFVCKIIAKCCDSLDLTQLADVRRQADSQMTMYRNKELKMRQAKRRGEKTKIKTKRFIRVEESSDPVYVDGSYNDTDFDAFF